MLPKAPLMSPVCASSRTVLLGMAVFRSQVSLMADMLLSSEFGQLSGSNVRRVNCGGVTLAASRRFRTHRRGAASPSRYGPGRFPRGATTPQGNRAGRHSRGPQLDRYV